MKLVVKYHDEPIALVQTLVEGYLLIRDEFKKRWPSAIYGVQEAAAHGLVLIGTPDLTPEEARELRRDLNSPRPQGTIADAYRQGV